MDLQPASEPEVDFKAASEPELDPQPASEPELDPQPASEPELDPQPASEVNLDSRSASGAELDLQPVSEPELDLQLALEPKLHSQLASYHEFESQLLSGRELIYQSETGDASQSESVHLPESESSHKSKVVAGLTSKPEFKSGPDSTDPGYEPEHNNKVKPTTNSQNEYEIKQQSTRELDPTSISAPKPGPDSESDFVLEAKHEPQCLSETDSESGTERKSRNKIEQPKMKPIAKFERDCGPKRTCDPDSAFAPASAAESPEPKSKLRTECITGSERNSGSHVDVQAMSYRKQHNFLSLDRSQTNVVDSNSKLKVETDAKRLKVEAISNLTLMPERETLQHFVKTAPVQVLSEQHLESGAVDYSSVNLPNAVVNNMASTRTNLVQTKTSQVLLSLARIATRACRP